MANQTGIAIVIKAFLPTGKTLDEQFTALTIVKEAHASGDYSKLLAAAKIDDVKAEQKTRRVEDAATTATTATTGDVRTEPKTAAEAVKRMADDGDADPEGTARLNWPGLFAEQTAAESEQASADDDLPSSLKLKTGRKAA